MSDNTSINVTTSSHQDAGDEGTGRVDSPGLSPTHDRRDGNRREPRKPGQ